TLPVVAAVPEGVLPLSPSGHTLTPRRNLVGGPTNRADSRTRTYPVVLSASEGPHSLYGWVRSFAGAQDDNWRRQPLYARRDSIAGEAALSLRGLAHLDVGALLLELERGRRIAAAPAPIHPLDHVLLGHVRHRHRHVELARQLRGEADVLASER